MILVGTLRVGKVSIRRFNIRMAKNKISKVKGKTKKQKIRHLGLKILFGVPLLLLLIFLSFELFKEVATRLDIKELDQAEAKMRQLSIAKADFTQYGRSCSYRSVKYGNPGPPNCFVNRIDIYRNLSVEDAFIKSQDIVVALEKQYSDSRVTLGSSALDPVGGLLGSPETRLSIDYSSDFDDELSCSTKMGYAEASDYLGDSVMLGSSGPNEKVLGVYTSCYKRFLKGSYPEM